MNLDQQISKYVTELQPLYRLFASKVQELVCSILKANDIVPHSVTSREKTGTSLKEKMTRDGKAYEDPLHEITDLAGVRIITYFPKDVDATVPILEKEFVIDKATSVDKRQSDDPSAFGYASVHLVVGLTKARSRLPEYGLFTDLKCEIQVRTILQHAWAEIEHDIVYQSNEEIPFQLRRKFASLAGLPEVADREFEMLRHEETEVRKTIAKTLTADNLDIPINLDSVRLYLKKYHQVDEPRPNSVSQMIRLLSSGKVDTIRRLHEILNKQALAQGKQVEDKVKTHCPVAESCLLRFSIAIGRTLNLSDKNIGEAVRCPALVNPDKFGKSRKAFAPQRFRHRLVARKEMDAEPGAAPNDGPATPSENSRVTEGPSSVS